MLTRTLIAAVFLAQPVAAQDLPTSIDQVVQVELLPGWRQTDGTHMAGLKFTLAKGWKTYWRSPGDGGLPTRLDHSGSDNLEKLQIKWPHPDVFRANGMRSIGYRDSVVLPLHLAPITSAPIDLDLALHFGVCEDVCIPVKMAFEAHLSTLPAAPDPQIKAALAKVPQTSPKPLSCRFLPSENGVDVAVLLDAPDLPGHGREMVIETASPDIWVSEPVIGEFGPHITGRAQLVASGGQDVRVDPASVRLTLISSQGAMSYQGCQLTP